MLLCFRRGSNFCQITGVSLFPWPFSSTMIVTHHSWCMALLIFRTCEAFYQIFHTSLAGTAASDILDLTLYFWKVSWDFIYWVINAKNRPSIFIIICKRTPSVICPCFKVFAYTNLQGKDVMFLILHFFGAWGVFLQCLLHFCSML